MERFRIAVLWRGDREARQAATPQNNRYHRVFEELAALGIDAEPAVYDETFAAEVRQQLWSATESSSGSIRSAEAGPARLWTRCCAMSRRMVHGSAPIPT
jgi:hypothetical protein